MSLKFIKGAQKPDLNMVKVEIDGNQVWADCTSSVKNFAKSNFSEGQEVEFEYSETQEGKKKKYKIDGLIKAVGGVTPPNNSSNNYQDSGSQSNSYSGDKNITIRSQTIGKMVAQSLVALQGHVDPNNINGIIDELYKKYDSLIK